MFVLKKIVAGIFMPLPLVLELLIAGLVLLLFSRRQTLAKGLIALASLLLLFTGFGIFAQTVLAKLENLYAPLDIQAARQEKVTWVVVLAGGHTTAPQLPLTSQLAPETVVRLNEGIRIHRQLPGSKLLVSGGSVFGPVSSASLMAGLARELGIRPGDIVLEDRSRDTGEEAELMAPMVGKEPFALVTSAYHMPRAMALFKARDMNPMPAPTGHYAVESTVLAPMDFFPRAEKIELWEIAFHELMGLLALELQEAWNG